MIRYLRNAQYDTENVLFPDIKEAEIQTGRKNLETR